MKMRWPSCSNIGFEPGANPRCIIITPIDIRDRQPDERGVCIHVLNQETGVVQIIYLNLYVPDDKPVYLYYNSLNISEEDILVYWKQVGSRYIFHTGVMDSSVREIPYETVLAWLL